MAARQQSDSFTAQEKNTAKKVKHLWQSLWIKLLLVVILLFSACAIFLKIRYAPDQCVNQFIEALDCQDYQTLKTFLSCEDVEINEDSLKPFIDLYHADNQFKQDIKNTLNRDLSLVNLDTYNTEYWIKLVSHRKFLIKTYTIQVQPVNITLSSNLSPVTVSYANQSQILELQQAPCTVSLLPGLYQFDTVYYDSLHEKDRNLTNTFTLCSDQDLDLDYDCSTLVLDIPEGYELDNISIDGTPMKDSLITENGDYQCYPVFPDEVITLTCDNSWEQNVTTSFTIPDEYANQVYHHVCDFSSTTMEFRYEPGLTVTTLSIDGLEISNLADYVNTEDSSIVLTDLTDNTTITTTLQAPWGETFEDSYTVSKDNFDEYIHPIHCFLSEETKNSILDYARAYYLNLFQALNEDDMDTLALYADDDEMANDFYVTLENIQYDYDMYSGEMDNFEEDIQLEPGDVYADKSQLDLYSENFALNLMGKVIALTTSMDEESMSPVVETAENSYNVTLHIIYDSDEQNWTVTASYYDYETTILLDPVQLN